MNYYNQIKNNLIDVEINNRVKDYSKNKYALEKYYEVGRLLIEAQGGEARSSYGDELIKDYSEKLTKELGKGYSWRTLYRMRSFYMFTKHEEILSTALTKLSWSHYIYLLSLNDNEKIKYYMNKSINNSWSVRELRNKIKSNEYERLPEQTKKKFTSKEELSIEDEIKNPIIIKNDLNVEEISEKLLQKLILDDMPSFLKELGEGFAFIDKEYPIKIGNNYNYIDLLLFNYKYNSFVLVELKVTELRKEHVGQIQIYMNYIDKNIKQTSMNKTIGIIVVRKNNKYIIEYSSDERIISREYKLKGRERNELL